MENDEENSDLEEDFEETEDSEELNLDFAAGIDEVLDDTHNLVKVSVNNLEELILRVRSHTGLTVEQTKILLPVIFQEIRHQLLHDGHFIFLDLGEMYLDKNTRLVFKSDPSLIFNLNNRKYGKPEYGTRRFVKPKKNFKFKNEYYRKNFHRIIQSYKRSAARKKLGEFKNRS
jgi:hypothetical protein